MATQSLTFNFVAQSIRVIMRGDEPWFVATDVCEALTIANSRDAVAKLDEDERADVGITDTSSNGITQGRNVTIINESGLYSLILTSRKPEAKKFKKWVTSEVLPAIRKTGRYEAPDFVAEELINGAQVAELKHLVWQLGRRYHMPNGGEWAAFALVRETFGIENAYRLPARHYPEALALLQWAERLSSEFRHRVIEIERKFCKSRFKVCPPELDRLADEIPGLLLRP